MSFKFYPDLAVELEEIKSREVGADAGLDALCQEIDEDCRGKGAYTPRFVKAMGEMTPETRCIVHLRYKELYNKEIEDSVAEACKNSDFRIAMQLLSLGPLEAECKLIDEACKGMMGPDKNVLSLLFSARTNEEMHLLKKKYYDLKSTDLGQFLIGKLKGDYEKLIVVLLQAMEEEYNPEFHTEEKAEADAEQLYEAGEHSKGKDIEGIFKIIALAPPQHLQKISAKFIGKYGITIQLSVAKVVKSDVSYAINILVGMKTDPISCLAWLIKEATGRSTQTLFLTSILIRFQPHIPKIEENFKASNGKTLSEQVQSSTKKEYQEVLLEIIKAGTK